MSWPVSLLQSMSLVVLSGFARAGSEVVGGDQGVGVVVTEDPAHGGEGVLAELASLLIVPQLPQVEAEVADRLQGVGVVVTQHEAAQVPGALEQRPGGTGSPRVCRYSAARLSSQATSRSTSVRLRTGSVATKTCGRSWRQAGQAGGLSDGSSAGTAARSS